MKVGVIADIHSNAEALVSVLNCLGDVEEIWCLGDIVGYGPEPARCIKLVREQRHVCVVGNHDLCVLNAIDISEFNIEAIESCVWNRAHLSDEELSFLRSLPATAEPMPGITLVHGSPRKNPWEYVSSSWQADEILSETNASITFVGHSHNPLAFMKLGEAAVEYIHLTDGNIVELNKDDAKYLINPGSVGQPRDGDPRASYMIFDTEDFRIELHRIDYPIEITQEKMLLAGLPTSLMDRLKIGI